MSYISAELSQNKSVVTVWERDEHGDRDYRVFRAPYYFYYLHDKGEFTDTYGKKLAKAEFNSYKEFWEAKEEFHKNGIQLFESDIGPEYKILSEHYYNKPVVKLNITFFDIEVDKNNELGYATIDNPYAPIISIALYHHYNGKFIIYAVPPDPSWVIDKISQEIKNLAEVVLCKDEAQLLKFVLAEIENTDVLSGWNSSLFDIPYLYFRLNSVLGNSYSRQLSFEGAKEPKIREIERFNVVNKTVDIFGRVSLDYLEVFRKLEQYNKPSYALEAIADEQLPELPKLEYEGSLSDLYRNDFEFFLRYNIRDTEILKGLEEKLKYIQFAIEFSHAATGMIDNVLGTIKLSDLNIINICHYELNKIVPDIKKDVIDSGMFAGALVLESQIGMHEWGSSIDVKGLYPSIIRTLNISPETIIGQFLEKNRAFDSIKNNDETVLTLYYENGFSESFTGKEWRESIKKNNWNISAHGTVYTQEFQGFIAAIVESWVNKRNEYKHQLKLSENKLKSMDVNSIDYQIIQKNIEHYDKLQYIYKIRNNSIFGILGNPYFRFYDIRNAESITRSGREVLLHMAKSVAKLLDGEYKYPSYSILAGDTDSNFFKTGADNLSDAIKVSDIIVKAVNNSFSDFLSSTFCCNDHYNKFVSAEWEYIFDRGIFVQKKLYVLHLVYKSEKEIDEIKLMGLQLKKTTIPKIISKKLTYFVEQLLKGREWTSIGKEIVTYKDELVSSSNILQIGLPKGIKGIEKYTNEYSLDKDTRLPGHVAAAIHWNKCLEYYKDKNSPKITSGMKIKIFYLKKMFERFKSIAIPTDMKVPPEWFNTYFYDIIDRDAQLERLVDGPLENIIGAIGKKMPTKKSLLVDEVVEY